MIEWLFGGPILWVLVKVWFFVAFLFTAIWIVSVYVFDFVDRWRDRRAQRRRLRGFWNKYRLDC